MTPPRIRIKRAKPTEEKTLADKFVGIVGSWNFIVTQTIAMAFWMALNGSGVLKVDPFPYILLNLMLSTQAALVGPIILMSSNRQGELDRKRDIDHYMIDVRESEVIDGMATELERLAKRWDEDSEEHWAG